MKEFLPSAKGVSNKFFFDINCTFFSTVNRPLNSAKIAANRVENAPAKRWLCGYNAMVVTTKNPECYDFSFKDYSFLNV